jgi:hypothetical protein
MKQQMVCVLAVTAAMMSPALAQQCVYPAKGQSAQQQAAFGKARAACLEGKHYKVK